MASESDPDSDTDTAAPVTVEHLLREFNDPAAIYSETSIPIPTAPEMDLCTPKTVATIYVPAAVILDEDESGTTGADIRRSSRATLGDELSPGTVYPQLHRLLERGLLNRATLTQSKRYTVADADALDADLADSERQLRWLLALCVAARKELATDTEPDV